MAKKDQPNEPVINELEPLKETMQPIIAESLTSTVNAPEPIPTQNDEAALDAEYEAMQQTAAAFQPEEPDFNNAPANVAKLTPLTAAQKGEIRMYFGFACFILVGLNTFILNKISKTNVPTSAMDLDSNEIDSMMPYLENEKVLQLINKLPKELLAFLHFEFMMITKFRAVAPEYKKIN